MKSPEQRRIKHGTRASGRFLSMAALAFGALTLVACGEAGIQGDVSTVEVHSDSISVVDALKTDTHPSDAEIDGTEDVQDVAEDVLVDAGVDVSEPVDWQNCDEPGDPGCECTDGADCNSGWCVTTGDGTLCSDVCEDSASCPAGWSCSDVNSSGGDISYICVPLYTHLCRPCSTGSDCQQLGGTGGYCVPFDDGEGSFCGGNCKVDDECPQGYMCDEVDLGNDLRVKQCLPESGQCACNLLGIKDGATTDCLSSNAFGSCPGTRSCGSGGLSLCEGPQPQAELCNGADDNCDGAIDEDIADEVCELQNAFGICEGMRTCTPTGWSICDATTPQLEVCDGVDNNCSGFADDGFLNTDGDLEADCVDADDDDDGVPDIVDNCPLTPNDDQADMDGDFFGDVCDDDIDGDGFSNPQDCAPTDAGLTCIVFYYDADEDGYAQCNGVTKCLCEPLGKFTVSDCSEPDCDDGDPLMSPGAVEICDNKDNNCNGFVDEGEAGGSDIDNDGVSDACDPDIDGDSVLNALDNCPNVPNFDQAACDDDGLGNACDADDDGDGVEDDLDCMPCEAAMYAGAPEVCDGIDNDCNGLVDDGFPDSDGDNIKDACDIDSDGDGVDDALDNCLNTPNFDQADCDGDGFGNACDVDDDNDDFPDFQDCAPCDANANAGQEEVCDGVDNNCNDAIDEGCEVILLGSTFGNGASTVTNALGVTLRQSLGTQSTVGTSTNGIYRLRSGLGSGVK